MTQESIDLGVEPAPFSELMDFIGVPLAAMLTGIMIAVVVHSYGLGNLLDMAVSLR